MRIIVNNELIKQHNTEEKAMNYFINYDSATGISINTFRNTGHANSDILDLVADIHAGR